jgi:hypothetical protein
LEERTLPSFLAPVSYPVGVNPDAVAVGDFTGTGILDLVVVNHDSGNVSVLLGKGDGTFQPAQNYAVGAGPKSVAVGDFNGDGKLDIVTANDSGTVSVLLGKGDGTFQPTLNYSLPTEAGLAQTPASLAVGDFNNDGKLDVAVTADTYTPGAGYYAGTYTAYINVLIGSGAGGFTADNSYALGPVNGNDPSPVAVGDFNGDNKLDLAVGEASGDPLAVLLGNGNGTFYFPPQSYWYSGLAPASLAVGDVNGDGKMDLVAGNRFQTAGILLGSGNGSFGPPAYYGVGGYPESVGLADLSRDGKLDIVTANYGGSVGVLLGKGDGTFHGLTSYAAGPSPVGLAVGDFNRDGLPDVAVVNSQTAGTVSVLLNTGDWTTLVASFPSSLTAGVAGNLTVTAQNPDGTTATNYTGTVHFTSSDPQAVLPADYTFTAADAGVHTFGVTLKTAGKQSVLIATPATPYLDIAVGTTVNQAPASRFSFAAPANVTATLAFSATITAYDAYGNLATNYTGTVHFTSTDPTAVLPAPYTFTTGSGSDNGRHTFGNGFTLNTAGSQTITATNQATSSLTAGVAMTVASPFFLAPMSYPVGYAPVAVAVGDFDGDGTPDLVVANRDSGDVSVLLGKGNGTFQPAQNYAVGGDPVSIAVGDFNGDGKLDIVTANYTPAGGSVSVLLGKGDGTFQTALNYSLPTEAGLTQTPTSLAVGDFNKDGKLDVAVTASTFLPGFCYGYDGNYCSAPVVTGYINVLIGNGAGNFSADNVQGAGDPYPVGITAADFNGDGNLDLAVGGSYSVSVQLGNGNGTFGNPVFLNGAAADSVAVGDFNGDGKLDLVTSAGQVFLGNGNGTFAPATVVGTAPNPVSVAVADFNHDGKLDIVTGGGIVSVVLGNADGTFGPAVNSASGGGPALAVGDFNRDGFPDLVVANAASNTVSVLLNPAEGQVHWFAVSGFPSPVTAGTAGSFTVTVENGDGTTDANYTGTVHFTSTDPQAVLPADYTFTAADAGRHTFSATLKTAGAQSITATDTTAAVGPATDAGITVNPAAASQMLVAGFPSPVTAGVAGTFTVTLKDPYGNVAASYTGTVHFTSSDRQAVLPADYTFTAADAGVRTFSATLKTAGTQSITARDTTKSTLTGTDAGITVNPAAASKLIITAPSSVTAGVPFSLTVKVEDAYGNVVTGYTGTVTFTSTDPKATLPKPYTFTAADKGVHIFTGLVLRKKGYQKITITDTLSSSLFASVLVDVV